MDEKAKLENKICDLLSLGSGVLAVGVVQAALSTFSEAEIYCALVRLCETEVVSIDREGVHLLGGKNEQTDEAAQADEALQTEDSQETGELSDHVAEDSVSPIPPIGAAEELLGSSIEPDYSDTYLPDEEIDAMLARMGYTKGGSERDASRPGDPVGEKQSKRIRAGKTEKDETNVGGPFVADSSIKRLNLKTRAANYCVRAGIHRMDELVRSLSGLPEVRGLGLGSVEEIRGKLQRAALQLPSQLTEWQVGALCWLSGSQEFAFDAFGILCAVSNGNASPIPKEVFCAGFSEESNALAAQLGEYLTSRKIPIDADAMCITVLPQVQQLLADAAENAELRDELLVKLVDALESDEHAIAACACDLRRRVRKMVKHAEKGKTDPSFEVPDVSCWIAAAQQAAEKEPMISFDSETRQIAVRLLTLEGWADTLKENQSQALALRLQGMTLEEVGNELGVTRERIRQITTKALDKRPALSEDKYRYLFDGYQMTKEQFCAITGEPGEVYEYLDLTKEKGLHRRPLEEAMDDEALDDAVKSGIRGVLDEGFAYIDGERVALRRKPVIEALLRKHAQDAPISLDELMSLYRAFADEHGMSDSEVFEGSGQRAMKANLDRWGFSLRAASPKGEDGIRRDIRYYDWSAWDFGPLRAAVEAFAVSHDGVECSAALLMRDAEVRGAAEEVCLSNEYELHCAMSRVMAQDDFLTLGKRPMVQFGEADRGRQVLDLIRELGPIDGRQLAGAYEERYGVAAPTVQGSFLKEFAAYETDGVYAIEDVELTGPQRDFLGALLRGRPYTSLMDVRERLRTAFPDASGAPLSERTLEPLGYTVVGSLIVRRDADLPRIFGEIMDSRDVFSVEDADLGPDVMRSDAFKSELNKRIRAFQVVEYKPDHFVRAAALARAAVSVGPDDLRSFVDAAIEFMEPGHPYSVKSLRAAGFDHPLFNLSDTFDIAGDYFFGALIATGYVGSRIKLTPCNGVYFFCKKSGSLSMPDVVEYEVSLLPELTETALQEHLRNEHGVEAPMPLLRSLVNRAGVTLGRDADSNGVESSDSEETAKTVDFGFESRDTAMGVFDFFADEE